MSERIFRIVLGALLLITLGLNSSMGLYAFMGLMLFEGITNWRIPILVSKARFGDSYQEHVSPFVDKKTAFNFEAERMLRFIVLIFLVITHFFFNDLLWWFPWFIGIMLCSAGLTGICPMYMTLNAIGFR